MSQSSFQDPDVILVLASDPKNPQEIIKTVYAKNENIHIVVFDERDEPEQPFFPLMQVTPINKMDGLLTEEIKESGRYW